MIKLKGGAGFAVGMSIREVVHAVALDSRRILPVSSLVNGPYGIRDVCISVPTVVGREGRRGPARDRALAQGSLGASAFGPGAARDDRPVQKSNPKAGGQSRPAGRISRLRPRNRPRPSPSG